MMNKVVKEDLLFLGFKILIFLILLVVTFGVIFGVFRNVGYMMEPAVKDGDLILYYRLQKEYQINDVVIIDKEGDKQVLRIVAKEGDVVDITEEGLKINGYLQQENKIYTETLPYEKGIKFPITIGKGEYFVLGDNRTNANDSRIYGTVKQEEIKGNLMILLRRRGV